MADSSRAFLRLSRLIFVLLALFSAVVVSLPTSHPNVRDAETTCRNVAFSPFDYSVKPPRDSDAPICPATLDTDVLLFTPHMAQDDEYACSEIKPCRNGACCPKETGWCNYGPKACGTTGTSPNDVCWSNCDAKAECGRYADPVGKECPLNVCCSPWGFCGMTEDFCTVTDDDETSCQNNCEQPDSGSSDGNVRKRVLGYYEAWVHDRKCNGMSINQIPVGALTHLLFSFAYVTPDNFQIVPMDDLESDLFSKMSALKKRNKALKVMVALGGWTFNDPGPTQKVFSEVSRTKANRSKFIANLLSFLRQYAYDGVDFDWEYPGADDRGGTPEDGENFTLLLEELRDAIKEQPIEYVVSFTTPTSFWYLRHFDLKASTAAVDFVNIMSYDLHGLWDAWNPIGSNILAHTNLTEIKLALDLYWRNDIPPEKLNLGIGFYGRSFQLSDPTCYRPGCLFAGGAAPGPCTANSGTLAYREIVDIIETKGLKPYYDKKHQVKYIVWNQDQWVSYDDEETIKAKIDFANDQGLGGLLVWSVDQDTDDLQALEAVVGPETIALAMKNSEGDDAAYWQGMGDQSCYLTDCGDTCNAGFKKITSQPCGGAKPVTRHSKEEDSQLCCPLTSAPDPEDCTWRGSAPSCNGRCHDGEAALQHNRWGDGKYCEDGNKIYCCAVPQGKNTDCYWSGMGKDCRSGDKPLTFAGTFLSDIADFTQFLGIIGDALSDLLDGLDMTLKEFYCCPPEDLERWTNCEWHGEPGSCYDNHCDLKTQVQLATNRYGLGESCSPRLERSRVFCCDPPDGESLFLPVPLEDLFKTPPTGDDVDTDFDLKIDNTWGDGEEDTDTDDDPDEASFQFHVLASPDEIQITLDKRDGSHWELFNCNDAVSEEGQVIQMVCTDTSENSNCGDIEKGDGAPGTILQMPKGQGCGPGKYAVAKSMEVSKNQTLPRHLTKRKLGPRAAVYDLAFDYDFTRVPRKYGDTQFRIDYSNQKGYWDNVVAKASDSKRKRSLEELNGNHRRWLEEEWRDDLHYGALGRDELHKRWFGEDVLDWLKALLNVDITTDIRHDYEEDVSVIILQEEWTCKKPHTTFEAKIDAVATASIKVSSSFGFTLITTLLPPLDVSKSFLHFNNAGEIEAIFTLDALMKLDWDSGVFNLATLPLPGASFYIPGIMTVGPHFNLDARFKAGMAVEGHIEARVTLAEWEIRQTFPQQNDDYDPKAIDDPKRGFNTDGLREPTFDATVEAFGYAEAHLLPTLSFGIEFEKQWKVDKCTVELVADGYVRLRAKSSLVGGDCGFGYAIDAGASLKAQATVPDVFDWHPDPLTIGSIDRTLIPKDGEYECLTGDGGAKRSLDASLDHHDHSGRLHAALHRNRGRNNNLSDVSSPSKLLKKRLVPYGPIISLPSNEKVCPNKGGVEPPGECINIFAVDSHYDDADDMFFRKRGLDADADVVHGLASLNISAALDLDDELVELHQWDKRLTKASIDTCQGSAVMSVSFPDYQVATVIYDNADWSDCNNYDFGIQPAQQTVPRPPKPNNPNPIERYITEHVLEAQMLQVFSSHLKNKYTDVKTMCKNMAPDWKHGKFDINNEIKINPWDYVGLGYPGANDAADMMNIIETVNLIKENVFKGNNVPGKTKIATAVKSEDTIDTAIRTMKNVLMTYKYMAHADTARIFVAQAIRVSTRFEEADNAVAAQSTKGYTKQGLKGKWETFVKGHTTVAITKMEDFLDHWMDEIEKLLDGTDATEDDAARATRRTKIETLRAVVDATKGTWTNPF